MKKSILISILIGLILITSNVSATVAITASERSTSYIQWSWSPSVNVTALSIDGFTVNNFDRAANGFLLSDLPANETHTIRIYTSDEDIGTNTSSTLLAPDTSFFGLQSGWAYVILILIMFLAGAAVHWVFFWLGTAISLYALWDFVNKAGSTVQANAHDLLFWIYAGMACLGILLWILKIKRRRR